MFVLVYIPVHEKIFEYNVRQLHLVFVDDAVVSVVRKRERDFFEVQGTGIEDDNLFGLLPVQTLIDFL